MKGIPNSHHVSGLHIETIGTLTAILFITTLSLRVYKFLSYGHSRHRIGAQPQQAREINRSQKCQRQTEIAMYLVQPFTEVRLVFLAT
jgi:hypothetical protein